MYDGKSVWLITYVDFYSPAKNIYFSVRRQACTRLIIPNLCLSFFLPLSHVRPDASSLHPSILHSGIIDFIFILLQVLRCKQPSPLFKKWIDPRFACVRRNQSTRTPLSFFFAAASLSLLLLCPEIIELALANNIKYNDEFVGGTDLKSFLRMPH